MEPKYTLDQVIRFIEFHAEKGLNLDAILEIMKNDRDLLSVSEPVQGS
jgi:hypothetical protein